MQENKTTGKEISTPTPQDRKAYQKPELKQLGSVEKLTNATVSLDVHERRFRRR